MDWINTSVDEFCLGMGLPAAEFQGSGVVQLEFDVRGTLHIERIDERLVMFLSRTLSMHDSMRSIYRALRLCDYRQGWPFRIRCGLLGEKVLVLAATLEGREVTRPALEQSFDLLCRLHDEVSA